MIKLLLPFIVFAFIGCSSKEKEIKKQLPVISEEKKIEDCHVKESTIGQKHLIISAMNKSRILARCFDNFLKFEEDKLRKIYTCNVLTIRPSGHVEYVYSRGQFGSDLPKDLKMCMEQEMWKMNFQGLQLTKTLTIQFPIEFNSN